MTKNKCLLIILDGWGLGEKYAGNAIYAARPQFYNELWEKTISKAAALAAGEAVGLPDGQCGTSEVNHMTIGSGRILFQDLVKINRSIKTEEFGENTAFLAAFAHVKKHQSVLHIQGLISDGGVHSHQAHVFALLKAAKEHGVERIFIHVFTDGRDTKPKSAAQYIKDLQNYIKEIGVGQIVSISGRYYAMDRDHNWERTDKAFEVLQGQKVGHPIYHSVEEALADNYNHERSDEFIEPALIEIDDSGEIGAIATNDAVLFVNFRNDRTRQLTERLLTLKKKANIELVTMTTYKPEYDVRVAFAQEEVTNTLGEVLAAAGKKQLRVTETEKFAHLTFFFNAKREAAFEGEDRFMIDSYSDIATHDEKPQMRTKDLARRVALELEGGVYDFIATNWCNADMVGHTSNIEATIEGVRTIDEALAQVVPLAKAKGYHVIITADHGNAEEMRDLETGENLTAHTINPVPLIILPAEGEPQPLTKKEVYLSDIAPTILKMMGVAKPPEMTGESLV
jgi:2,3-bisphosphoglycerate-independent phosphoglycerate mutase